MKRRINILLLAAVVASSLVYSCEDGKRLLGIDNRVGSYATSYSGYKKVAGKVARGFALKSKRVIVKSNTKDPGIEYAISFPGGEEGNFKIYKMTSATNMNEAISTYERMEKTFSARAKKPYTWCFLTRKDLLFDCQMIPKDHQGELKKRFLNAVN